MKMMGPCIIGIMLIAMSLGVLVIMLPLVIQPVIERNDKALAAFPLILRWFWYASVWLRANPFIPSGLVGALVVVLLLRNTPSVQPYWIRFTMWWNVTRKLILGFNSMLIVYFLPALLRSGMPTYQALEQLAFCVNHPLIRSILLASAEDHRNGLRMSQAVENIPFKASFFNAIVAGEATGAIADRVEDLQGPYKIELERYIKQVASTLKFIVMVVLLPLFIICTYTSLVGPIFALMEYGR
jgi:type II secretory pathway component PulF